MQIDAKVELANAIRNTSRIRESSWDGRYYSLTFADAARRASVDPELAPLVTAMLGSGLFEFADWAAEIADTYENQYAI
jgi:hypothetical protein